MYLGYADNKGKNYFSIGKELVKRVEINLENISMQSIMKWMRQNKDEAKALMNMNERFIFFKERDNEFLFGSSKAVLEPMHSVAVDNKYIPSHLPIWGEINNFSEKEKVYRGLFVAHDTGAAIKGPLRFDVFLGNGNYNEHIAEI